MSSFPTGERASCLMPHGAVKGLNFGPAATTAPRRAALATHVDDVQVRAADARVRHLDDHLVLLRGGRHVHLGEDELLRLGVEHDRVHGGHCDTLVALARGPLQHQHQQATASLRFSSAGNC